MLAVTVTDQIGLGSIILAAMMLVLAVPASYLAWRSIQGLRAAAEAERIGQVVHEQLERVLAQVTPSNGRTTAHHVEEIERMISDNKEEYTAVIRTAVEAITEMQQVLTNHLQGHRRHDDP